MTAQATEAEVATIGPHRLLPGKDMYFVKFVGDLTCDHVTELQALNVRYLEQNGYVLLLVDASDAGTMKPEARRLSVEYQRGMKYASATAIFGTNLVTYALASLLYKAMRLVSGQSAEHAFFTSETAARAWLDKQRTRLSAARDATRSSQLQ